MASSATENNGNAAVAGNGTNNLVVEVTSDDNGRVTVTISVPDTQIHQLDAVLGTVKKSFQEDTTYHVNINLTNITGKVILERTASSTSSVSNNDERNGDPSSLSSIPTRQDMRKAFRALSAKLNTLGEQLTKNLKQVEQRIVSVVNTTNATTLVTAETAVKPLSNPGKTAGKAI